MAASRTGPRAPKIACGRRHCTVCKCWRLIIDFPPRRWKDKSKSSIKYVQSECHVCRARQESQRVASYTKMDLKRRNQTSRSWHRRQRRRAGVKEIGPRVLASPKRGSVRREPFAEWLREKLSVIPISELAMRCQIPERRIHILLNGYDTSGKSKAGKPRKLRPVDWVSFDTVDKALTSFGESWVMDDLYPPETPQPAQEDHQHEVAEVVLMDPAFTRRWDSFDSLMQTAPNCSSSRDEFVPDLIGEYERRLRLRQDRRQARTSPGGLSEPATRPRKGSPRQKPVTRATTG